MRVQDERHVRVVLDDAVNDRATTLDFDCATDGSPHDVVVTTSPEYASNAPGLTMSVEWLERAAAAARRVRERAGDVRRVCPDHGYFSAGPAPCPRCDERERAADVESNVKSGAWRSSDV